MAKVIVTTTLNGKAAPNAVLVSEPAKPAKAKAAPKVTKAKPSKARAPRKPAKAAAKATAPTTSAPTAQPVAVASGVQAHWQGSMLWVGINCSDEAIARAPLSGTGRSRMLANTGKFASIKRGDGREVGVLLKLTSRIEGNTLVNGFGGNVVAVE